MLNYAWKKTMFRTVGVQYGNRYIYSAWEFGKYLMMIDSNCFIVSDENDLENKNGIIYFYNYHIDLSYWDDGWFWDSAELVGNRSSNVKHLISKHKTYFWALSK